MMVECPRCGKEYEYGNGYVVRDESMDRVSVCKPCGFLFDELVEMYWAPSRVVVLERYIKDQLEDDDEDKEEEE